MSNDVAMTFGEWKRRTRNAETPYTEGVTWVEGERLANVVGTPRKKQSNR